MFLLSKFVQKLNFQICYFEFFKKKLLNFKFFIFLLKYKNEKSYIVLMTQVTIIIHTKKMF